MKQTVMDFKLQRKIKRNWLSQILWHNLLGINRNYIDKFADLIDSLAGNNNFPSSEALTCEWGKHIWNERYVPFESMTFSTDSLMSGQINNIVLTIVGMSFRYYQSTPLDVSSCTWTFCKYFMCSLSQQLNSPHQMARLRRHTHQKWSKRRIQITNRYFSQQTCEYGYIFLFASISSAFRFEVERYAERKLTHIIYHLSPAKVINTPREEISTRSTCDFEYNTI